MQEKMGILVWAVSCTCDIILGRVEHGFMFAVMINTLDFRYGLPLKII